jgi:hypothetical protein
VASIKAVAGAIGLNTGSVAIFVPPHAGQAVKSAFSRYKHLYITGIYFAF